MSNNQTDAETSTIELVPGGFKPSDNFDGLRKQARALYSLARAQQQQLADKNDLKRQLDVCRSWQQTINRRIDQAMHLLADIRKFSPDVRDAVDRDGNRFQTAECEELLIQASDWVEDLPGRNAAGNPQST